METDFYRETSNFISKKSIIDEFMAESTKTNDEQSEAISSNKEAIEKNAEEDVKQGNAISENKAAIEENEALDAARDEKIESLEESLDEESKRAEKAENDLSMAISDEATRASEAEEAIDAKFADYTKTTDMESAIATAKQEAIDAATYDDTLVKQMITDEVSRATDAEEANATAIREISASIPTQISTEIAKVIDDAPESFDTLKEIATWIETHASDATAMNEQIQTNKEDISNLTTKISEENVRATVAEEALNEKFAEYVKWINSSADRKHIVLNNHDSILGTATDDTQYNLAMVSKWDVADFGTNKLHMNLNSSDVVTINDTEKVATESWVEGKNYLTEHQSLADYAKSADVSTEIATAKQEAIDAASYDDTEVKGMINTVDSKFADYQVKGDYALASDIPSLNGYATESWVEGKNYLTEHQSLADYATVSSLDEIKKLMSQIETRLSVVEVSTPSLVVASSADDVKNIAVPAETNLVLSSKDAIESMTDKKLYKSIAIVGGDTEKSINIAASENVVIDGLEINGSKDGGNGKINYSASTMEIKNVTINHGNTNYNVFEGSQVTTTDEYASKLLNAHDIVVDDVNLTHNVVNVYTPANDGLIRIADSYFNLNVSNSNVCRISNTLNSDNVVIEFENVEWTYENKEYSSSDVAYAGLLLYQPYGNDSAFVGDTSHIATWTIKIKNCKYNGELITEDNFGTISQIGYTYNIGGKSYGVGQLGNVMTVIFE